MLLCTDTESALLQVAGPDARKFLQGQTTCDINQLSPTTSLLGAHCNPKGRMIADFRALALDDTTLLLRTHASTAPLLSDALGKYIVFSKATRQPADLVVSGLCGSATGATLAGLGINTGQQVVHHPLGIFIRINAELCECWHSAGQQQQLQAALPQAQPGTLNDWRLARIDAGIGQVTAATSGEWIPQMLNYQLEPVRGVSFTKGCYTGQEIVARMQYRGKLKRHMYRFDSPVELPPGTPLFIPGSEQSAGEVVICGSAGSGSRLLAVATSTAVAADHLFANSCGATPLHRLSLPYELPDSTAE